MTRDRQNLPQLSGNLFLTDGGIETTLIFREGLDLPLFASFYLLKSDPGREKIKNCLAPYAAVAKRHGVGCILESVTWRASSDWGEKLGYSPAELRDANHQAIDLLQEIRKEYESDVTKIVISGCLGPRGDGYTPAFLMTADEAKKYHAPQVEAFRDSDADLVTAMTITYPAEAIGLAQAAVAAEMPVVISFTVENNGRLPDGHSLQEAIDQVDDATGKAPLYYMINCAHPTHIAGALQSNEAWIERIRGLRANASKKSHAELNDSTELDDGNPAELGREYRDLQSRLRNLNVLGGCCGTDERHVEEICKAWLGKP